MRLKVSLLKVRIAKNSFHFFKLLKFLIFLVLKTKLVRARMDQAAKKVYVSSTMHRTFGRAQWQQLRDLLHSWKNNLSSVQEGMKSIAAAQLEMVNQQ